MKKDVKMKKIRKNKDKVKNKRGKKVFIRVFKWEYVFNILSILIILGIGIYYGARSFYYYSKQNVVIKKEEETLKAAVLRNNKITTQANGLHQEKDGIAFKGMVDNNYLYFGNRLYRIMKIYEDNSVRIVSNTNEGILNWGDESSYQTSNLYHWLNKGENVYSGVYEKTIPGEKALLKETEWCEGTLSEKSVKCDQYEKSYFVPLTLKDYVDYAGKNSYLYNKQSSFLVGKSENSENLSIAKDGTVQDANSEDGYGIRVVMTLKKNIKVSGGSGSLSDPYIINQEGHDTNINKYVKLGEDVYKIYEEKDNILRLSLNDYAKIGGSIITRAFNNRTALYTPLNRYSIAYYLNRDYYRSLPYNTLLSECSLPVGEVSTSEGLSYFNQYNEVITNKIGLLSLYDYNNNDTLTDFYLMNTTGSSMAYVYHKNGILGEAKVSEGKNVVSTVCIDKNLIKSGDGTLTVPYVVE